MLELIGPDRVDFGERYCELSLALANPGRPGKLQEYSYELMVLSLALLHRHGREEYWRRVSTAAGREG